MDRDSYRVTWVFFSLRHSWYNTTSISHLVTNADMCFFSYLPMLSNFLPLVSRCCSSTSSFTFTSAGLEVHWGIILPFFATVISNCLSPWKGHDRKPLNWKKKSSSSLSSYQSELSMSSTRTGAFSPLSLLSGPFSPIDIIWVGICGEIHCEGSVGDKLLAEKTHLSLHHVHLFGFFVIHC